MDAPPGHLEHEATIDALEHELIRTVALAEQTPGELPIPTCPGWSAADLWDHLGTVHRWVTEILTTRSTERVSRRKLAIEGPTGGRWAPWMADGADRLLAALRATASDEPVWAWGADHHARWWARRQLHETVVHDADAALALGEAFEVPPAVAADGICELLDNLPVRLSWPNAVVPTTEATVHLHATDGPEQLPGEAGEWMVTVADGTITYTHGHGKGDAAVRGPVRDLMLVVNRRLPPERADVEVLGEPGALHAALDALALN